MSMGKKERISITVHKDGIALTPLPALDRCCDGLELCVLLRGYVLKLKAALQ